MRFDIVTIFPNIFDSYINESILKLARENKHIEIHTHDPREFSTNKHKKVDDTPYGGGPGMVLAVQPFYDCLKQIPRLEKSRVLMMDPGGVEYSQPLANHYAAEYDQLIMLCGRYEGFDERIYNLVDERISIGKYVLAGGELPAMIITETVARHVAGVLGNENTLNTESYSGTTEDGELDLDYIEHPQYTKPSTFVTDEGEEWKVPDVLLNGNHAHIEQWRTDNQKQ